MGCRSPASARIQPVLRRSLPSKPSKNAPAEAATRSCVNSARIRSFTSSREDAQSSSVASIDAPAIHALRITWSHQRRSPKCNFNASRLAYVTPESLPSSLPSRNETDHGIDNPFEIPQYLRDVSEQNLKQADAAYKQLMDFVSKAKDAWMEVMPENAMSAGFKDVQNRAMDIVMENPESTLGLAGKISNAKTFQEILTLQSRYVQDRMQAFVTQTQQLFNLIAESLQKSKSGTTDASLSTTFSNPMIAGFNVTRFEDVQDRAVAIAKQNADSALALVEKMAKAQNIQELLTLETKFAQEQMQAHAGQTQELQRMIGKALQG
jgi:hypothetical protein